MHFLKFPPVLLLLLLVIVLVLLLVLPEDLWAAAEAATFSLRDRSASLPVVARGRAASSGAGALQ